MIPLLILIIVLALFALWVWMLVDCLRNERDTDKIVWLLVLILLPVVGTILYLFMRFHRPPALRV